MISLVVSGGIALYRLIAKGRHLLMRQDKALAGVADGQL